MMFPCHRPFAFYARLIYVMVTELLWIVAGACLANRSLFVDTSARNDAWLLMLVYFLDFRIIRSILGKFWLLVACLVFEPNEWLQVRMGSGMTPVKRQGKGSRKNGSVTSGKGSDLRARNGVPSFEPVDCRRTACAAHATRASSRVPAKEWTGNGSFGGLPQASNNQLRTDSHCPCLLSSETTAKGMGLAESAGKEDLVELDTSPTL
ncbi:hypothetical protein Tco_1036008 [Tanacetum coccineum]